MNKRKQINNKSNNHNLSYFVKQSLLVLQILRTFEEEIEHTNVC